MSQPAPLWCRAPDRPPFPRPPGRYFDWIERSTGPKHEAVRERVQRLWDATPSQMRADLLARMKASRADFHTAYAEMWFMRSVASGGLATGQAARTPGGSTPDFGIFTGGEPVAVAEVKLRFEDESESQADEQQYQWFRQTFERMENKRIRVVVSDREHVRGTPSARMFAQWLDATAARFPAVRSGEIPEEFEYKDPSGWKLRLSLFLVEEADSDPGAQLMMIGVRGFSAQEFDVGEWLDGLDNQHGSSTVPVLLCVGWNDFQNQPDQDEVLTAVFRRVEFLERRRIFGVCWANSVTPYGDGAPPLLVHWGRRDVEQLVRAWRGGVHVVQQSSPAVS